MAGTTDLQRIPNGQTREIAPAIEHLDVFQLGKVLAQSGYFRDAKEAAQAVVKVLAGRELGVGPVAAMTGVHIIEGKPTVSAGLMASAVKRSGKYDYELEWQPDDRKPSLCIVTFYRGPKRIGSSSFSLEDAQAAGLAQKPIWKQYARNMLFARALSNGVRWYCPDVFEVGAVYVPEELGANVDGDGDVIPPPALPAERQQRDYSRFWARVKAELKLSNDQVHEILNVESLKQVDDLDVAYQFLEDWVDFRTAEPVSAAPGSASTPAGERSATTPAGPGTPEPVAEIDAFLASQANEEKRLAREAVTDQPEFDPLHEAADAAIKALRALAGEQRVGAGLVKLKLEQRDEMVALLARFGITAEMVDAFARRAFGAPINLLHQRHLTAVRAVADAQNGKAMFDAIVADLPHEKGLI